MYKVLLLFAASAARATQVAEVIEIDVPFVNWKASYTAAVDQVLMATLGADVSINGVAASASDNTSVTFSVVMPLNAAPDAATLTAFDAGVQGQFPVCWYSAQSEEVSGCNASGTLITDFRAAGVPLTSTYFGAQTFTNTSLGSGDAPHNFRVVGVANGVVHYAWDGTGNSHQPTDTACRAAGSDDGFYRIHHGGQGRPCGSQYSNLCTTRLSRIGPNGGGPTDNLHVWGDKNSAAVGPDEYGPICKSRVGNKPYRLYGAYLCSFYRCCCVGKIGADMCGNDRVDVPVPPGAPVVVRSADAATGKIHWENPDLIPPVFGPECSYPVSSRRALDSFYGEVGTFRYAIYTATPPYVFNIVDGVANIASVGANALVLSQTVYVQIFHGGPFNGDNSFEGGRLHARACNNGVYDPFDLDPFFNVYIIYGRQLSNGGTAPPLQFNRGEAVPCETTSRVYITPQLDSPPGGGAPAALGSSPRAGCGCAAR